MDYLTLKRRELTALMRKQREAQLRLDAIRWEHEVLHPALEELERRIARGERFEFNVDDPEGMRVLGSGN